ncbi:MAG: class E sortase [Actinomycetota bacterium]|nr:class E sortase [Actinomycetota bacterium]
MRSRTASPSTALPAARRLAAALVAACALLAACSDDSSTAAVTTAAGASTTTAKPAPTTTRPATTTTKPSTTTSTSSTIAASTTTAALPVPQPPPEPRAAEPHNELGTIEIPALDVVRPLLEGVTLTTLDKGPGHWPGTAMPGHVGNVVIGGHRTSKDRPFRYVDQLVAGDEVIFTTAEGRFVYKVTSVEIVTPDAIWVIDQTPAYTATLFACHPVGSTKERIIVHLALVA